MNSNARQALMQGSARSGMFHDWAMVESHIPPPYLSYHHERIANSSTINFNPPPPVYRFIKPKDNSTSSPRSNPDGMDMNFCMPNQSDAGRLPFPLQHHDNTLPSSHADVNHTNNLTACLKSNHTAEGHKAETLGLDYKALSPKSTDLNLEIAKQKSHFQDDSSLARSITLPDRQHTKINKGNYATMLYQCLMEAEDHQLELKDIYQWFETHTEKPSCRTSGWRNSVRHNLSMNEVSLF